MDNFKSLTPFGASGVRKVRMMNQDKGHREQFASFFSRVREGGAALIPREQLIEVARLVQSVSSSVGASKCIFYFLVTTLFPETKCRRESCVRACLLLGSNGAHRLRF